MLVDLKNKILTWSPAVADAFHNHVPRINPKKGGYLWAIKFNGFYHWGPDAADFYSHNGMIYSLQKKWYLTDWEMHKKLYEISIQLKEFRISEPMSYQMIDINGEEWVYTEIRYPDNDIGYPGIFNNLLSNPDSTVIGYIDDLAILLKYFKLLDDEYSCGYPSKVKIGNRISDSQGFFWKDIKYWGNTKESFLRKHIGEVQKLVDHTINNNVVLSFDPVEYAKTQWMI